MRRAREAAGRRIFIGYLSSSKLVGPTDEGLNGAVRPVFRA